MVDLVVSLLRIATKEHVDLVDLTVTRKTCLDLVCGADDLPPLDARSNPAWIERRQAEPIGHHETRHGGDR
ncbi:MAG: hypothetical protein CL933_08300 [Deltaproteobacteria bacterium]|nr:hypothetical protein [Deltaproteobacteria bacterium]